MWREATTRKCNVFSSLALYTEQILPKQNLDIVWGKWKIQHIDNHQSTLCEKSQSVFFLLFLLAKVDVKV